MDVHQASISIAVTDAAGKVQMECIIETKAATVLEFIQALRGSLSVTFEEGTSAEVPAQGQQGLDAETFRGFQLATKLFLLTAFYRTKVAAHPGVVDPVFWTEK